MIVSPVPVRLAPRTNSAQWGAR